MCLASKLACNIFLFMTVSQIPSKLIFATHRRDDLGEKKVYSSGSIYFLLFKTKLIASHAAPANCFSIFHRFALYWIHIFRYLWHIPGPHIVYCVSKGLPGLGDNLCRLRTKKDAETEYVFEASIACGHPHTWISWISARICFGRRLNSPEHNIQAGQENMQICGRDETRGGGRSSTTNCAISINSPKAAKTVVECCSFSVCYIRDAGEEKSHAIFNKWAFEEGKNVKDVNNAVLIAKCL